MELRHLRYFVALSQTLSFTRAAGLVHVTQSTMSHQIGQLEQELGVTLFFRDPRGLRLTPEGDTFLAQAQRALAAIDAGVRELHGPVHQVQARIHIGATPSMAGAFVAPVVARLLQRQPAWSVVLLDMTPPEIAAALATHRIELGIAYPPLDAEGLTGERLFVEEMVVVVGPTHALAQRRHLQVADLHGRAIVLPTHRFSIRQMVDEFLREAGAEPMVVAEVDSLQATLTLMQKLDAAALLPARSAPGKPWCSIPVERPFASRVITLYRRRSETLEAAAKACHDALCGAAKTGPAGSVPASYGRVQHRRPSS